MAFKSSVRGLLLATTLVAGAASSAHAAQIVLHNTGGVEAGTKAAIGFAAAANFWGSRMSNDITIHLNVGFDHLGANILGQTGSTIETALVEDIYLGLAANAQSALDAQAVNGVAGQLVGSQYGVAGVNMVTPGYTGEDQDGVGFGIDTANPVYDDNGNVNNVVLGSTTANLKALGLIDPHDLGIDGEVTFSSDFDFDFHPENGIKAGYIDFIGVAIHEIGHALGFVSGVDDYDFFGLPNGPGAGLDCGGIDCSDYPVQDTYWGYTGDLFRFSQAGLLNWNPGDANYFSVDGGATNLANFSTGDFNGDGWQASHWKTPAVACQNFIGILNPYICGGKMGEITAMDFAYFDAIGYNFNFDFNANDGVLFNTADANPGIPEPGTWALMILGMGLMGATLRRRRLLTA